jgi:thiamine kinase-like enzyme
MKQFDMSVSVPASKPGLAAAVRQEGFPVHPAFPQLAVASDARMMLEAFRAHLTPVDGRDYHIEDCRPFRFRFTSSGSRCVLQYRLRLREPATGRQWELWVTGLVFAEAGEAERLWREIRANDPRRGIAESWLTFEPVDFIPDLQMLVEVFPYDRKLRNLGRLMSGALREVEPLLLERLEPGQWSVEGRTVEPTRYRTELGAALKYTLEVRDALTANSEAFRCYVKVYRNDHGAQTFDLLRSLSERGGEGRRRYAVVRPIAYLSELRALVLEEAAGTPLQQVLLQGSDPGTAVRAVARAVAAFNQEDLSITRRHSLADQLDEVQRASSLVQWACPAVTKEVEEIAAAVVRGLADDSSAPIHRDLKTDHIFLSNDRVILIDLDSAALGDPVRDPAHLVAHIVARVGLDSMPRERARAVAGAFVEEYFAHVPEPWRERFSLHCAGALVEVARGIFKRQEPEWPGKVTAAIAEARRVLSEGF